MYVNRVNVSGKMLQTGGHRDDECKQVMTPAGYIGHLADGNVFKQYNSERLVVK